MTHHLEQRVSCCGHAPRLTAEQLARTSPNRRRQLAFTQLSAEQQNAQALATRSSSGGGTTSPWRSPPDRAAGSGHVFRRNRLDTPSYRP